MRRYEVAFEGPLFWISVANFDWWQPSGELADAIKELPALAKKKPILELTTRFFLRSLCRVRSTAGALGADLKRSKTVGDEKVCPDCEGDEAGGWINIDDTFSGSDTADVPHHPNCRCAVYYKNERTSESDVKAASH